MTAQLTTTIGIKETAPGSFRLTFNGRILGDSQGFPRDRAIEEARRTAAQPDGDWHGSDWVEITRVLDPALEAPAEPRAVTARRQAIVEIAAEHGIATLLTTNSDRVDFHDLHVATITAMLEAAYKAGKESK